MIGEKYWSTGIILKYYPYKKNWSATCKFYDSGWCQDKSTEGQLYSRYFGPIETVIDNVKTDAEKLGIEWKDTFLLPHKGGDSKKWPMPPNWKTILKEQANRIGWKFDNEDYPESEK